MVRMDAINTVKLFNPEEPQGTGEVPGETIAAPKGVR